MRTLARRMTRMVIPGLLVIGALAGPLDAQAAKGGGSGASTTFKGQATALRANVLGIETVLADTGPLPPSGGALEASVLSANVPGLVTANVLHASTVGQGNRTRSEASAADLDLTVGGNEIEADFLMARAEAACGGQGASLTGSSEIVNLTINGESVSVGTAPNQTIPLPGGGSIIINEQSTSDGTITVNALHVRVPGVADVVVSSASAGAQCAKSDCVSPKDFVTGGGWITTPAGGRGTFGVAGGIKNGGFWGHLTYIDHATGLKVKGTGVTAYEATGPTSRHIEGTAEINGAPGTYSVDVADNGEPGRNDTFEVTLSNGYSASGRLEGGNIQLHRPCR